MNRGKNKVDQSKLQTAAFSLYPLRSYYHKTKQILLTEMTILRQVIFLELEKYLFNIQIFCVGK